MSHMLIACMLFVSIASEAFAINAASDEWKERIQLQITKGNLMDAEVIAAQEDLEDAQSGKASPARIRQLELTLQRTKDRQMAAYTKAIHQTIEAYGLEPRSRRGTSVISRTIGREIHWIPVAGDQPTRFIQGADGEFGETARTPISWAGRTFVDGVTYINPETIRLGPEFIATTLLHERIHFEQFTTRGRGDKLSSAEREVEANRAELAKIDSFFDKSSPYRQYAQANAEGSIALFQRKVDEQRAAKRGLTGLFNRYFPPKSNADFEDSTPHAPAKLAALKRQSDDFESEVRAESQRLIVKAREQAVRDRRERETRQSYSPAIPIAVPPRVEVAEIVATTPAPFSRILPALAEFSRTACRSPNSAVFPDMQRGHMTHEEYYGPSRKSYEHLMDIELLSLSGCAKKLFIELEYMALNRELWKVSERGWLERRVAQLSPDQPTGGGRKKGNDDADSGGSPPSDPDHGRVWDRVNPIIRR